MKRTTLALIALSSLMGCSAFTQSDIDAAKRSWDIIRPEYEAFVQESPMQPFQKENRLILSRTLSELLEAVEQRAEEDIE